MSPAELILEGVVVQAVDGLYFELVPVAVHVEVMELEEGLEVEGVYVVLCVHLGVSGGSGGGRTWRSA